MASESQRGGLDIGWQHGEPVDGSRQKSKCKYCHHVNKSGGVTRLKQHLAGGYRDVIKCTKCPKSIREQMMLSLQGKLQEKANKEKRREAFTEALLQPPRSFNDDDDDSDFEYPPDCTTDYEKAQHRLAIRNSMADRWDAEQQWRINMMRQDTSSQFQEVGGSSSRRDNIGQGQQEQQKRRAGLFHTTSARHLDPSLDHDMFSRPGSRQKKIREAFGGGSVRKSLNKMISIFFFYSSIPANVATDNPYYQPTIDEIARCGPGFKGPSAYELMHGLLDDEYNELQDYIKTLNNSWAQYGVTIMCDGWTGPTRLSIINFMVYCDGKSIFHKSIDVSAEKKDAKFIYQLMNNVVKSIGKEYVIQIVTDNGSAFVKAGKKMMEKYNLFWTPCAAHCIDLMLKDIGSHQSVKKVVDEARKITNYIYNHHYVLALMREKCRGDIIRPGITRFATNYIALRSILEKRQGLKEMFASREWANYDHNRTPQAREVEEIVARTSFWEDARHVVNCLDPIAKVLRLVDGDKTPTMGSLYEAIRLMREQIKAVTPRSYKWILRIVDNRWTSQLCHPLHQAAYFLNPLYQYKHQLGLNSDLIDGLNQVVAKLLPDGYQQAQALSELKFFRDATGSFGSPAAQHGLKNTHSAEWWNLYGSSAPNLKVLAVKILSQTASSSGCERNWSTFGLIHSKQRNRLGHERLQKLVFVHYNMRLRAKNIQTNTELGRPEDLIDLTDIYLEEGDENPLYEWVKDANQPLMDEPGGRPSSYIAAQMGADVDEFMSTEVNVSTMGYVITSISDSEDDGEGEDDDGNNNDGHDQDSTQPPDDDDNDDNDGGSGGDEDDDNNDNDDDNDDDDGGGNASGQQWSQGQRQQQIERETQSQVQMSPFTGESQYDHSTQDADHGSRLCRKTYGRRRRGHISQSRQRNIHDVELAMENVSIEGDFDNISSSASSSSYPTYQQQQRDDTYQGVRVTGWIQPNESYNYGGVMPTGWTENQASGSSNSTSGQSFNSQPSILSHGRHFVDDPRYPRVGILTKVDMQTYQNYIYNYQHFYHTMFTWHKYCKYIENQYFNEGSTNSGDDGRRRSMYL